MGIATTPVARTEDRPRRTTGERVAFLYGAASVVLGPLIVFGIGGHKSGFDCTDGSWGDLPMADRHAIYVGLGAKVVPATIVMMLVGVAVLVGLARSNRGARSVPAVLLCLGMLCGYGLILVMAFVMNAWTCL